MTSWICYNCGSYNVFETMLVRINHLACILDAHEDVRGLQDASAWCEDCDEYVTLKEAEHPLYAEI
jgi:hypothetical protein